MIRWLRGIWAAALVAVATAAPAQAADPDVQQTLAQVRQATARYHDVAQALADGYVPVSACVEDPSQGAMGIHYLNSSLVDLVVRAEQPEVLLYIPTAAGPRLVGVEYFVPFVGQPAPELYGRPLNGPMPGHEPGMPTHFDLHAWVWQANPAGIFADSNPNLSCG